MPYTTETTFLIDDFNATEENNTAIKQALGDTLKVEFYHRAERDKVVRDVEVTLDSGIKFFFNFREYDGNGKLDARFIRSNVPKENCTKETAALQLMMGNFYTHCCACLSEYVAQKHPEKTTPQPSKKPQSSADMVAAMTAALKKAEAAQPQKQQKKQSAPKQPTLDKKKTKEEINTIAKTLTDLENRFNQRKKSKQPLQEKEKEKQFAILQRLKNQLSAISTKLTAANISSDDQLSVRINNALAQIARIETLVDDLTQPITKHSESHCTAEVARDSMSSSTTTTTDTEDDPSESHCTAEVARDSTSSPKTATLDTENDPWDNQDWDDIARKRDEITAALNGASFWSVLPADEGQTVANDSNQPTASV